MPVAFVISREYKTIARQKCWLAQAPTFKVLKGSIWQYVRGENWFDNRPEERQILFANSIIPNPLIIEIHLFSGLFYVELVLMFKIILSQSQLISGKSFKKEVILRFIYSLLSFILKMTGDFFWTDKGCSKNTPYINLRPFRWTCILFMN